MHIMHLVAFFNLQYSLYHRYLYNFMHIITFIFVALIALKNRMNDENRISISAGD
jgi:hypothetical protein